jgi:hypothetical protein
VVVVGSPAAEDLDVEAVEGKGSGTPTQLRSARRNRDRMMLAVHLRLSETVLALHNMLGFE